MAYLKVFMKLRTPSILYTMTWPQALSHRRWTAENDRVINGSIISIQLEGEQKLLQLNHFEARQWNKIENRQMGNLSMMFLWLHAMLQMDFLNNKLDLVYCGHMKIIICNAMERADCVLKAYFQFKPLKCLSEQLMPLINNYASWNAAFESLNIIMVVLKNVCVKLL